MKCKTCGRRPSERHAYIDPPVYQDDEPYQDDCPDPIHDLADRAPEMRDVLRAWMGLCKWSEEDGWGYPLSAHSGEVLTAMAALLALASLPPQAWELGWQARDECRDPESADKVRNPFEPTPAPQEQEGPDG